MNDPFVSKGLIKRLNAASNGSIRWVGARNIVMGFFSLIFAFQVFNSTLNNKSSKLDYSLFLVFAIAIALTFIQGVSQAITRNQLIRNKHHLTATLSLIDKNGKSTIDPEENKKFIEKSINYLDTSVSSLQEALFIPIVAINIEFGIAFLMQSGIIK